MDKVTKDTAHYQMSPNDGEQCNKCTMYEPPMSCSTVKGIISYRGWCKYFKRRSK